MMSVKNPATYNNWFKGDYSEETCKSISEIRECQNIEDLKHMIFNFPAELVIRSILEETSIRDIVKAEDIDYSGYIGELRPYQTVGLAFMYLSKRSMIGDGVGLGKTAEICGLLNLLKQRGQMKRFIMAVETTALEQTRYELLKFTGLRVVTLPSEGAKMKRVINKTDWAEVDGIVIKHPTLKSNAFNEFLAVNMDSAGKSRLFDVFILDESSVIKNDTSQMHHYTKNICKMVDRVHFMNATAFDRHIMDIFYQMDMLSDVLLPEASFMKRNFCVWTRGAYWKSERQAGGGYKPVRKTKFDLSGYKNQAVFKESLKLVYLGRSKEMVGMDIPHVYKVYSVAPTTDQQLAINKGHRYNEVLNCPSLVLDANIKFNRESVPKLDRLCELCETELKDSSIMVYCFHVDAQYVIKDELEKIGRKCCVLNGDDPGGKDKDMKRLDIMSKFNSGEYDVIITNMQKSLNLYGADAMVIYSNTATVGRLEQIRGRIDRHVDDKVKTFIMLLYAGTAEYELMTHVARERGQASRELILDAETAIDHFMAGLDGANEG